MPANIREFLSHPADVGGGDVAAVLPGVSLLVIFKVKHFQGQTLMANSRFGQRVG